MSSKTTPRSERLIASFGRRRGRRLRASRRASLNALLPKLQLTLQDVERWRYGDVETLYASLFPHIFPSSHPHIQLEIGFGGGEHLLAQAEAHPQVGFIGCEPYIDGVGGLLRSIARPHPTPLPQAGEGSVRQRAGEGSNIRLFLDDARLLIERLPDACLERVFILFPDPWPKTRHHKRRLIQAPFLDMLARVMQPGVELRLATDHEGYLTWMLEQLLASPYFAWTAKSQADWTQPPPDWVCTRYQARAEAEGRGATYLCFQRK